MSFAGRRRGNKVKKGVQFTLMVVGELFLFVCSIHWMGSKKSSGASGTGRTTFVNTLCESEVLQHKVSDNPETAHVEEGIRIKPANVGGCWPDSFFSPLLRLFFLELEEDGVRIALTIVDTPGFGDNIDNEFAYVHTLPCIIEF
jgi:cell division control protein 11